MYCMLMYVWKWHGPGTIVLENFTLHCQDDTTAKQCSRKDECTLLERARCMLLNVGLSKDFWAEVVNHASYLVNQSPSTAIGLKTPEELWSGSPADYS